MTKPFFSIVIPTYNRCELLKAAMAITLKQTCKDFELIISDNASTDETEKVVKSFKDQRIRYYRNKKNIGAEANMRKILSYVRGEYIFSLGDDDFILYKNTLEKVKKLLDKKPYGFVRLNLIERKLIGKGLRKSVLTVENDIEIKKNSSSKDIMDFFGKINVTHFAGLVIKSYKNMSDDFFNLTVTAWVKIIYKNTKKYGAYYIADLYMLITWSQGDILTHYNPINNRLMFEDYTNFVFSVIPKEQVSDYTWRYFNTYVILQPVIKLYSNNNNLIVFNKRLLKLEPRLKKNIFFWIFFAIAFVTPRFIWEIVRVIQHKSKNTLDSLPNKDEIYKRFALLNKRYYSA